MSSTAGKVIRCRAAVTWEAGKPMVIEVMEATPPQAMEVLIKIAFTSLCHTDVYFWEAQGQSPVFPRIFGHESGGYVPKILNCSELAAEGACIAWASWIVLIDLINSRFEEVIRLINMCNLMSQFVPFDVKQLKKFGVTQFVNPEEHKKPVQEVLAEMTDGGGNRSIECTGNIDSVYNFCLPMHSR
ncbi:Alcohol dehydrogenase, N-terminal, partial [Dillenia turbinata]